ncbi:MAG TPA: DoxX family protein [Puia sp.]|nr:DoxX family protein [Puia sp.]
MQLTIKIINSILILFAFYMGIKQGWAMLSGKPEMTEMFSKWGFSKTGLSVLGGLTILGAILMLIPKTFVWGNFITAAGILLIIAFHVNDKDIKGVMTELPFFLLSFVIIYLKYPLSR